MTDLFLAMNAYDIDIRIRDEGRPPLAPLMHPHELTRGGVVMRDDNVTITSALVDHPLVEPAFAYRFDGGSIDRHFRGHRAVRQPGESRQGGRRARS
jgi:hypothetical protein